MLRIIDATVRGLERLQRCRRQIGDKLRLCVESTRGHVVTTGWISQRSGNSMVLSRGFWALTAALQSRATDDNRGTRYDTPRVVL